MTEDCDVYVKYPKHRKWFNKLWLSEMLGYKCGPGGTDIPEDGVYVVRPIYNLGGMGAGAKVVQTAVGDMIIQTGLIKAGKLTGEVLGTIFTGETKEEDSPLVQGENEQKNTQSSNT